MVFVGSLSTVTALVIFRPPVVRSLVKPTAAVASDLTSAVTSFFVVSFTFVGRPTVTSVTV